MITALQPALSRAPDPTHHSAIGAVEREQLASELRTDLMSVSSHDPKVIQLRKDLSQLKNKAPNTLAAILCDAHNRNQPIAERVASTIRDFFSSRSKRIQRKLRELSPIETKAEGEFEQLQNAIDLGDTSTPTLKNFVREIDEYVAVLLEMRDAAVAELYRAEKS